MTEQPQKANLDTIMRMVQKLIERADGARRIGNDAESETYTAKAQTLVQQYRIQEEQLIATSEGGILPIRRLILITEWASEFRHQHGWLWSAIARHCGVRYVQKWNSTDQTYEADTFGYDVDVRLAEMLYASARLVFGAHLEPENDPKLSEADNVYRMRNAGMARNRIAQILWGADLGDAGHAAHAKVGKLYKAACEARGEDPIISGRNVNAKTYREVYAREFVTAVESRLRRARDAADAAAGALVSVGRAERVDEAFYTAYPSYRPQPKTEEPQGTAQPARKGRQRGITKADRARWEREYFGPTAQAATRAAEAAAQRVELERTTPANRAEAPRRAGAIEG